MDNRERKNQVVVAKTDQPRHKVSENVELLLYSGFAVMPEAPSLNEVEACRGAVHVLHASAPGSQAKCTSPADPPHTVRQPDRAQRSQGIYCIGRTRRGV